MADQPLNGVLKHVRKLAAIQSARLAPDHALLQQFLASNDETALTVLIERHGPMVFGVCRRALRSVDDAEDAFQATFLVFSCKASSIRKTASVGSWLHGVALRVAAKLRREIARRKLRERSCVRSPTRTPADEVSWAEVQTVLDEELQGLPERYRAVLSLCYLDGKLRDDAAKELGITPSALHGLLERARKLLADRLTKRGVTLSAGLFGFGLCEAFASAALSATQVVSTAHAAALFAAGKPLGRLVSAGAFTLTQQVLKGMIMTKLKLVSVAILCCVLSVSTIEFTLAQPGADEKKITLGKQLIDEDGLVTLRRGARDTDEAFIRRVSKDLRGVEPTPAEIHFFVTSKEAKRREKLVDLFVVEREAKKKIDSSNIIHVDSSTNTTLTPSPAAKPQLQTPPDLALLKTNVELAKLVVREKEILLSAAMKSSNLDRTKIALLEIDLDRANVLLEQAELALTAAVKKSSAK